MSGVLAKIRNENLQITSPEHYLEAVLLDVYPLILAGACPVNV
jgi:hypothetical protein